MQLHYNCAEKVENHWFKDFTLSISLVQSYIWSNLTLPHKQKCKWYLLSSKHTKVFRKAHGPSLVPENNTNVSCHVTAFPQSLFPSLLPPFYTTFLHCGGRTGTYELPPTSRPLRPDQVSPPPLFTQGHAACRWWLQSTKCFMLVQSRGHLSHCSHNVSPRHPVSCFFVLSNPHILVVMLVKHNIQQIDRGFRWLESGKVLQTVSTYPKIHVSRNGINVVDSSR